MKVTGTSLINRVKVIKEATNTSLASAKEVAQKEFSFKQEKLVDKYIIDSVVNDGAVFEFEEGESLLVVDIDNKLYIYKNKKFVDYFKKI